MSHIWANANLVRVTLRALGDLKIFWCFCSFHNYVARSLGAQTSLLILYGPLSINLKGVIIILLLTLSSPCTHRGNLIGVLTGRLASISIHPSQWHLYEKPDPHLFSRRARNQLFSQIELWYRVYWKRFLRVLHWLLCQTGLLFAVWQAGL